MEQIDTFFGLTLVDLNVNLGWGLESSTFRLTLVQDDGQTFTPTDIGDPCYYSLGSLNISGLLQSYSYRRGPDGLLYDVVLTDPRNILEGVQLIIDRYTGSVFDVPNLYNIYGALESTGFGNAQVNEGGMLWQLVRDTFITLQLTTPVVFAGHNYFVDLSALPNLPSYYRIGSDSAIDLMTFIADICDAASHDFFFKLVLIDLGNFIKLYTVNRSSQPTFGKIANFLDDQEEVVRSNVGFELRNETASKFLVGGNVAQIYFNTPQSGTQDDFADDTILPYWGTREDGDVILGSGSFIGTDVHDKHNFIVPSRGVNVIGVGSEYHMNVEEMRAALVGQESWEVLLTTFNNDPNSIHFGKATKAAVLSDAMFAEDVWQSRTVPELKGLTPLELSNFLGHNIIRAGQALDSRHEENVTRYYEYVRNFAEDYYGKRFMVRIPFVTAAVTENSIGLDEIRTSLEPTDGGFIEEALWQGAVGNNLMPINVDFVTLEDNRIRCYARFDGLSRLDLSELSTDDYEISGDSVFVKATLQPEIQFLDRQTAFSPRAILELSGRVKLATEDDGEADLGLFLKLLNENIPKAHPTATEAERQEIFLNTIRKFGSEIHFFGYKGMALTPDLVAIPLQSNVDFYGPWYAVGAQGKTEFEQDQDLVPWKFDGYDLMNLTANARVSEALTNFQVGEGGSIELPGIPIIDLGAELISNGPYLTNINVTVGPQGITTSYEMSTWTPRFGKVTKQYLDQLKKSRLKDQKYRRFFRSLKELPGPTDTKFKQREFSRFLKPARRKPHTSASLVGGEMILSDSDNNLYKSNIIIGASHNVINHISEDDYDFKSINSLDVLFRPFTTDITATDWPHFETPTESVDIDLPTIPNDTDINNLHPYDNSDFVIYNKESYPEEDQTIVDANGYKRGIAMRGPIIIAGWGLDIEMNPVPNNGSNQFITQHKKRMDQWKVGPLDARWDDIRKLWAGGSFVKRGVLQGVLSVGGMQTAINTDTGNEETVCDYLLTGSDFLATNTKVFYVEILGINYVFAASCT